MIRGYDSGFAIFDLIYSSNVTKYCLSMNNSSNCSDDREITNTIELDMLFYGSGPHTLYVYYKDAEGNIVASMQKVLE